MDYEDLANKIQGNWKHFDSFVWDKQPKDADLYGHVGLDNRDSGLKAQSNADAIRKELKKYKNCWEERANHWGVGWVNFLVIKVRYKNGNLTKAFMAWAELHSCIEQYTVIDSSDYSKREYEATLGNIGDRGYSLKCDSWPDDWTKQVFGWLWDHMQVELHSVEDQGRYPSKESIETAARALGWAIEGDEPED